MSSADTPNEGVPSNSELAERTARIEEKTDHLVDSVDRIEDRLLSGQEELGEQVEENSEMVEPVHTTYRIGCKVVKWGVPTTAAVLGTLATLSSAGFV